MKERQTQRNPDLCLAGSGSDQTIQQAKMFNLVAIFVRLGLRPAFAWPFYFVAIGLISYLWRKAGINKETLSLATILILFFSPHLHTHDLALLIIPLTIWPAVIVPIVSILIVLASGANLQQVVVFGVMGLLTYQLVGRLKPYLLFK